MTLTFTYNGVDLGTTRVRLGSVVGLTTKADKGQVGSSDISFDDPTGTLDLGAHRAFYMNEDACSEFRCYSGYATGRKYGRADSLKTGAARRITASVLDLNAIFTFKVINHTTFHYNRPAETDIERITWLISVSAGVLGIHDNGLIDTANPVTMSAANYTAQFPGQVMQDCANASGKTFFAYFDSVAGETSLAYFQSTDASFYPSTLSISNVMADWSSTCFDPSFDAELERDPSQVFDGVLVQHSGGEVYARASGRVLPRDVVAPQSNTSSHLAAEHLAQQFLAASENEAETVTCTLKLPPDKVNLLLAGMMVNARFAHFPGWESGLDVRVLERSIKQDEATQAFYNVTVTLGHSVAVSFTNGTGGDNSHNPPSQQPPYVPSGGSPFTYVQSAKTANDTNGADATFGATPTAGNFLTGILLVEQLGGGGAVPGDFVAAWPSGWVVDQGPIGTATDQRLVAMWMAHKTAEASEPTAVTVDVTIGATTPWNGFLIVAEYTSTGTVSAVDPGTYVSANGSPPIPTVTPTGGVPALIVACGAHEPDYIGTTASAGYNVRQEFKTGGSRQALAYVDQLVTSASGSYGGTLNLTGGTDDYSFIPVVVYSAQGGSGPAIGQPVAPESATSDGSQVIYTTNYPYVPGSLVVKVNGVVLANVAETSPSTGVFTLPAPPASGAVITWTYNVADATPTGAANPPASSNPPAVPPDPGTVQGGDGVYRQPQQEYVPAETPDGVITVFTIVPYIAGNTLVYINGLIQRKGIDWNELAAASGTIEFTTAPWTGASITVTAMPVTAAATGSGFGNPALFGSGLNADSKSNIQMGPQGVVALRFTCGASDDLDSILIQARGGSPYSGGTGGAYSVVVKAVDANGLPTGSALATQTYTPGNPGGSWTHYDTITWGSPATLVLGTRYCIVFTNTDGSPTVNYVSINCLFVFGGALTPRQPLFTDAGFAVLSDPGSGFAIHRQGGDFTANIDLAYAGGHHDGQGYIQLFTAQYGTLSGTTDMVREAFTVSGGDRTVVSCAARVRRSSGTDPLILGLYTSGDVLIEAVSIPAALVPIGAAGSDNGGSVWAGARFLAPHVLTNGSGYYLRLSCAATSEYTAAPIRKGFDEGFDTSLVFLQGAGQFTTNSGGTWTDLYTFDTYSPDLQFYLGTTT